MKKKNLFLKSTSSLLAMLFVVMSAFMFTACDGDEEDPEPEPEPENSILEIISSSDNHTQLAAYLELYPDLIDVISDTTANLTVFAPNDDAFATLEGTLNTDLGNVSPAVIEAVLAFHVHTGGAVLRADISEDSELSTVQGESIKFNAEGNVSTGGSVDDVPYDGDEILATNGVVHSVGNILIPPVAVYEVVVEHLGKVSQAILLGKDFTTLAAAINKADEFAEGAGEPTLKSILSDASATLTVFAPVNAVFTQAEIELGDFTGQQWYGLIANHVLGQTILDADFAAKVGEGLVTLGGGTITVLTIDAPTNPEAGITSGVALDINGIPGADAQVAVADAFVSQVNGVVHALAGVLSPVSYWSVSGIATSGDTETFSEDIAATVSFTPLGNGVFRVNDITFGGYNALYDAAANPGNLTVSSGFTTVTIIDQPDVVYPDQDDVFNGSGTYASGQFDILVSNGYGDEFDVTLTKAASMGRALRFLEKVNYNQSAKVDISKGKK